MNSMLDPRIVAASTQFFEDTCGPETTATDVSTSLHGMGPQFTDRPPEGWVFKISWINCTAIARGIVGVDPIGALAHLQLGRAYVLSGNRAKARSAYQEFLSLWKSADTDVLILQQAKIEYAKLM
jgi:hypothetical protein